MFYLNKAKPKTVEDTFNPFIRKCVKCENMCECIKTDIGYLCVLCFKGEQRKKTNS